MTTTITEVVSWDTVSVPREGEEYNEADCYVTPHQANCNRAQWLRSAYEAFTEPYIAGAGTNYDAGPGMYRWYA
jgi:hypothetical protein